MKKRSAPLQLSGGSPVADRSVKLSSCEYAVLLTVHHIISDGWSMGVLVREVATLYRAYSTGQLPRRCRNCPPIMRTTPCGKEVGCKASGVLEEHLHYWRERLAGAPPVLQLPLDRPRPAIQRFQGRTVSLLVEAEIVSCES